MNARQNGQARRPRARVAIAGARGTAEDAVGGAGTGCAPDPGAEQIADQASRLAVTAVTADLEYWARTASVEGLVGLNDLIRVLDMIRDAGTPAA